jgi:hypothetical protein
MRSAVWAGTPGLGGPPRTAPKNKKRIFAENPLHGVDFFTSLFAT